MQSINLQVKHLSYCATLSRPTLSKLLQEKVALTKLTPNTCLFLVQKTKFDLISLGIYHIFILHDLA